MSGRVVDEYYDGAPEFMDADESCYYDVRMQRGMVSGEQLPHEKLIDKDFFNDFGDLFDPDSVWATGNGLRSTVVSP